MSQPRCVRESVFKAARTTDTLRLVWDWRVEQGGRCRRGAGGPEQGRSPPPSSKMGAEHCLGVWICCCSSFCSLVVGHSLLVPLAEEAQAGRVTLNLTCCPWLELRGLKGGKEPTVEKWTHAGIELGPSAPSQAPDLVVGVPAHVRGVGTR